MNPFSFPFIHQDYKLIKIWGKKIYFQFYRLIKCPFHEKLASQNSLQNKDSGATEEEKQRERRERERKIDIGS